MTTPQARIDVRTIAPRDRHPTIFTTFAQLQAGEALELVNDHDPQPLYWQFEAQLPGQFGWDYLEQGPATWRVAITRKAPAVPAPSTCGCGSGCGA